MKTAQDRVCFELESQGIRVRVVPFSRLNILQQELKQLYGTGILEDEFYREYILSKAEYDPSSTPRAKSILITAASDPMLKVPFSFRGKKVEALIPSTYSNTGAEQIKAALKKALDREGFSLYPVILPLKLLAVHSGLGSYGRNNIVYVPGMGSFARLFALASDLECTEETWEPLKRMASCDHCTACVKSCPTGCYEPDRTVIRAERCLTRFNESESPFPEWIEKSRHNALVGCTLCQLACPENRPYAKPWRVEEGFADEEVDDVLNGKDPALLSGATVKKLDDLGLLSYYEEGAFSRNLKCLLPT